MERWTMRALVTVFCILLAGTTVSAFGVTRNSENKPWKSTPSFLQVAPSNKDILYSNHDSPDYIDRGSYWVFMFYLLMVFRQRQGHVHVPLNHIEQGWPLGEWLGLQRMLERRNQLDPIRQERLQQAGVVWNLNNQHWQEMYQLLVDYHQEHGHAHVPQRYQIQNNIVNDTITSNNNTNLGTWLTTQRAAFRKGTLLPHRKQQLEALGVAWDQQEAQWENMYQLLLQFQQHHGHVQVPLSYMVADEPLGTWMASQRKILQKGTLSPQRQEQLQALLHNSTSPAASVKNQSWQEMYQLLVDFHQEHGHVDVPQDYQVHQGSKKFKLGTWLMTQRANFRNGKLLLQRQNQLEALGMNWDQREAKWEHMYQLLLQFHEQHGHVQVPQLYKVAKEPLGTWMAHQRRALKKGTLSPQRQDQLQALLLHSTATANAMTVGDQQ
jgi:Helicase associated domain